MVRREPHHEIHVAMDVRARSVADGPGAAATTAAVCRCAREHAVEKIERQAAIAERHAARERRAPGRQVSQVVAQGDAVRGETEAAVSPRRRRR
jgi:hypothetical protein